MTMKKPDPRVRLLLAAAAEAARHQWADALAAPRPVSERTYYAGKGARSCCAFLLLSSTENSHTPKKPMAMENSAGEV